MIEAIFISDLHLSPQETAINERFFAFLEWIQEKCSALYILGDFFHAWPGDDGLDAWSDSILNQLNILTQKGLKIYFMHGNRDFLVGKQVLEKAGMTLLQEPYLLQLNEELILLAHGDRYCTDDKGHQYFRMLTRNKIFPNLFMCIPFAIRNKLVRQVRKISQNNNKKQESLDIVPRSLVRHMKQLNVNTVIHGHTHKPGLFEHLDTGLVYKQYILSDWDDIPLALCYDKAKGFYFIQLEG